MVPRDHLHAVTILFHDDTATSSDLLQYDEKEEKGDGKKEQKVKERRWQVEASSSGSGSSAETRWEPVVPTIGQQSGIKFSGDCRRASRPRSEHDAARTRFVGEFDWGIYVVPTNVIRLRWQASRAPTHIHKSRRGYGHVFHPRSEVLSGERRQIWTSDL